MTKIFSVPFAAEGDKISPPDSVQSDGSVSYALGYGFDYQRDTGVDEDGAPIDPLAKVFPREQHNGILNDITEAVGEIQLNGLPVWQSVAAPYPANALVRYAGVSWRSTAGGNATAPGAPGSSWANITYQPQATESASGVAKVATTSVAQAGVNDTDMMTPLKTRQAIDNLLPVQATTAAAGIAKLATAAQAIAGADGSSIITPALLKQLFPKRSFAANDFIRIPDVPGGLIIQFGIGMSYPDISVIQNLPTPFPNALLTCGAQTTEAWTADVTIRFIPARNKRTSFYLDNSFNTSGPAYYWAIGY